MFKYLNLGTLIARSFSQQSSSNVDALKYCASIVRQHDYENFLATLLMTNSIRSPALVVRAFNVEVARIQDQTSDPKTAAFRLQFWRDTLGKIFIKDQHSHNIPANPVAQELFKISYCYKLPRRHLENLITARHNLLISKHFQTLEDVEKYADETVSSIYHVILSVASIKSVHADHVASHLGKAQGIVNILRSIHVSNNHKMVSLPMDILMKYQVSQEQILRGVDNENVRNATFEIASRANSHLEKAKKIASIPKLATQIFLPATTVENYLKNLQKVHFNLFDKSLQMRSLTLPFKMYYRRLRNTF